MKKTLFTTFLFLAVAGCAKNSDSNNKVATVAPANQNEYQRQAQPQYFYQQNDQGCTTGPQRFDTRERFCDGLRDDTRNNHCGLNYRYQQFREHCADNRWQR